MRRSSGVFDLLGVPTNKGPALDISDTRFGFDFVPDISILGQSPTTTRWSTTLSSKVNLPHAINFMSLSGANLTLEISSQRNPRNPPSGELQFTAERTLN